MIQIFPQIQCMLLWLIPQFLQQVSSVLIIEETQVKP